MKTNLYGSHSVLMFALLMCMAIANSVAAIAPRYYVSDLGAIGGTYSAGHSINAGGQVAGSYSPADDGLYHAFLWTPTSPNGSEGVKLDIGTLGGTESFGLGINDRGHVTGYSLLTGDSGERAFLYDGTLHELGTLGGNNSAGFDINASGQVTGPSDLMGGAEGQAFVWTPLTPNAASGTMQTLGARFSFGYSINSSGQITGYASTGADLRAFLWTPMTPNGASGTILDLGTLGGGSTPTLSTIFSEGFAINDSGQVVGRSYTPGNVAIHAFCTTARCMTLVRSADAIAQGPISTSAATSWAVPRPAMPPFTRSFIRAARGWST